MGISGIIVYAVIIIIFLVLFSCIIYANRRDKKNREYAERQAQARAENSYLNFINPLPYLHDLPAASTANLSENDKKLDKLTYEIIKIDDEINVILEQERLGRVWLIPGTRITPEIQAERQAKILPKNNAINQLFAQIHALLDPHPPEIKALFIHDSFARSTRKFIEGIEKGEHLNASSE